MGTRRHARIPSHAVVAGNMPNVGAPLCGGHFRPNRISSLQLHVSGATISPRLTLFCFSDELHLLKGTAPGVCKVEARHLRPSHKGEYMPRPGSLPVGSQSGQNKEWFDDQRAETKAHLLL